MPTDHRPITTIEHRFAGMPGMAHGGYTAGLLARALGADETEVRLRRPVPIGLEVQVDRREPGHAELRAGDAVLAEAAPAAMRLDRPAPVTLAQAEDASSRYPGHHHHPFPECLVCGPERRAGDGLRIFPGPVAGRELVAAPWVPPAELADDASGHLPDELVWASLDCPQLWSLMIHAPADTADRVVTAALYARLERPVVAGEPHVVLGWPIGREGRAWHAGAAVLGPDGELCVVGRQTAAVAGWGVPLGRDRWAGVATG